MNCNCWTELNEELKEKNLRLCGASILLPSFFLVPKLEMEWIDDSKAPRGQKKRPPGMLASHCPFCGIKIEVPKTEDESETDKTGEQAKA